MNVVSENRKLLIKMALSKEDDVNSILRELGETYSGEYRLVTEIDERALDKTDLFRVHCPHCDRQFLYSGMIHSQTTVNSSVIVCKQLQTKLYNKYKVKVSYSGQGDYPCHQWWQTEYQQIHNTFRFMEYLCAAPFTEKISSDVKTHGYSRRAAIAFLHAELSPSAEVVAATSEYCRKNGIQFYYFAKLDDNTSVKTYDRIATALLPGRYASCEKTHDNVFKAEMINRLKIITGSKKLSAIQFNPEWNEDNYPVIEEKQPINISPKSKANFKIIKGKNKES